MRIASIVNNDLANGPGVRTSIFVSGCPHHCPECHNPELWDGTVGKEVSEATINQIVSLLTQNGISRGLSVLGGEPLAPQNIEGVTEVCKAVKKALPDVNIWLWTGYDFAEKNFCDIMDVVDVVVDGKFDISLKPGFHPWRGSANQRVIDVKATKATGEIVLIPD